MNKTDSPRQLLLRLSLYFVTLIGGLLLLTMLVPQSSRYLPFGGTDAIEMAQLEVEHVPAFGRSGQEITESRIARPDTRMKLWLIFLFLAESLVLAWLIMLPISWTYLATRAGNKQRTFVRALLVLPICATTIVLLIQGSLALAFGLAAMVAAVRFRVRLEEPIDGIYIFAAICVGLAGGIGYLGVATVMAMFFCFANAILWKRDRDGQTVI